MNNLPYKNTIKCQSRMHGTCYQWATHQVINEEFEIDAFWCWEHTIIAMIAKSKTQLLPEADESIQALWETIIE